MNFLENINADKLASWFEARKPANPLFYSSVDIRDSGYKLAPVDTNIFPAGFNQLSNAAKARATTEVQKYISTNYPDVRMVGILAENFSRNQFYLDNIAALRSIIESAGYKVVVGQTEAQDNEYKTERKGSKLYFGSETPCLIIANRDFTGGAPQELKDITQVVIPPVFMGWYRRRKSHHFSQYDLVAKDFAEEFGFDPWLISTIHTNCGCVDFKNREGLDCVAINVERTLHKIRNKYEQYGIKDEPYVFVKSDSGTFGMGIMTVKSGEEILEMNKKLRNKMDVIKEGVHSTEVIIQEGVPTRLEAAGRAAEPFVYLIGGKPVGAILRINQNRDKFGNLNSAGMEFETYECENLDNNCENSPYGIISRLAALAASSEAKQQEFYAA